MVDSSAKALPNEHRHVVGRGRHLDVACPLILVISSAPRRPASADSRPPTVTLSVPGARAPGS